MKIDYDDVVRYRGKLYYFNGTNLLDERLCYLYSLDMKPENSFMGITSEVRLHKKKSHLELVK